MSDSPPGAAPQPLVVVMGVSGSGKTTVAAPLAARLGVPLGEADDFHPEANRDKMRAGIPLSDLDRAPWLDEVAGWLAHRRGTGAVVTCSALRRAYRDRLRRRTPSAVFLHLEAPAEVLSDRMETRRGHFMPRSLLDSQLDILEPLAADEAGVEIDSTRGADEIVEAFVDWWDAYSQ